jgi:hypothetical protein
MGNIGRPQRRIEVLPESEPAPRTVPAPPAPPAAPPTRPEPAEPVRQPA